MEMWGENGDKHEDTLIYRWFHYDDLNAVCKSLKSGGYQPCFNLLYNSRFGFHSLDDNVHDPFLCIYYRSNLHNLNSLNADQFLPSP